MSIVRRADGRAYIEGVRKVSWDTGEMCEFASSLISALDCLGENVPYHYVMGATGAAFRFSFTPAEDEFSDYGIRNLSADPYEPMRHAMAAVGYEYAICAKGARETDAARIRGSIESGVPVLAFPVVGPSDCCLITGYDQGGEVLLGWSAYQNVPDDHNIPHDATGYFRKPGWHDHLDGYLLIGARTERPPLRKVYLDALRWAVHLIRTSELGRRRTGLAGLAIWARQMTQEDWFPAGDEQALGLRYLGATINITMLRDHVSAEPFLRQAAEALPDLEPELSLAADCYGRVRGIRGRMDELISDNFSRRAMKAIGDPQVRRSFAEHILQIRDQEEEAVGHIERLLSRCG